MQGCNLSAGGGPELAWAETPPQSLKDGLQRVGLTAAATTLPEEPLPDPAPFRMRICSYP